MTRLPWFRTFGDPNDGYVQKQDLLDSTDNLRVMLRTGGPRDGEWWWTSSRLVEGEDGMKRFRTEVGYSATKEEAQEAAERAYFKPSSPEREGGA